MRRAGKESSSCGYLEGVDLHVVGASKRWKTVLNIPEGVTSVQLGKHFFMWLLFGSEVLKTLRNCGMLP